MDFSGWGLTTWNDQAPPVTAVARRARARARSTPMTSTSLLPRCRSARLGRAAHDLGLAGLLGGNLFGRLALHPSVTEISDEAERGKLVNAAWRRYGTVNSLSLLAVRAGWAGRAGERGAPGNLSPAERRLARAKDVLVGVVAVTGLATAAQGVRFARQAPGGAVPLSDGDHTAADAPPAAARAKRRLNALGLVSLAPRRRSSASTPRSPSRASGARRAGARCPGAGPAAAGAPPGPGALSRRRGPAGPRTSRAAPRAAPRRRSHSTTGGARRAVVVVLQRVAVGARGGHQHEVAHGRRGERHAGARTSPLSQ